jgi:FMN reductase
MSRQLVVVTAGLSQPSSSRLLADQLTSAVTSAVSGRGEDTRVSVIELRELAVDLAITMTTGGLATPAVARARDLLSAADGLIAVTPVFSGSYSGLFKMFFDVLDRDALNELPVLIAATAGSARHSLVLDHAMRPLFTYLGAVVVPTGVFAATEDFGGGDRGGLGERIGRAASQLAALLVADQVGVGGFAPNVADRRPRPRGSSLRSPQPFAALLEGHRG